MGEGNIAILESNFMIKDIFFQHFTTCYGD